MSPNSPITRKRRHRQPAVARRAHLIRIAGGGRRSVNIQAGPGNSSRTPTEQCIRMRFYWYLTRCKVMHVVLSHMSICRCLFSRVCLHFSLTHAPHTHETPLSRRRTRLTRVITGNQAAALRTIIRRSLQYVWSLRFGTVPLWKYVPCTVVELQLRGRRGVRVGHGSSHAVGSVTVRRAQLNSQLSACARACGSAINSLRVRAGA
jgi:hypothetical protein